MGNFQNSDQKEKQYAHFHLISEEHVNGLGKYEGYEDKETGKFYLVFETTYAISNPEMAESNVTQLKKIETIRNACALVTETIGKSKVLCFDNYSLNLCFEYYNTSMYSIIKSKANGTKHPEPEIWGIIDDLVQYLIELKNFDLSHGDLQPKNILFNKNKIVKILSPLLYTTYENAYKLRLANDDYKCAFSPELMEAYMFRNNSLDYDPVKSDIFSMGVSVLSYVRMTNFENYYNFVQNKIEMDLIRKDLSRLIQEDGYSEELFFIINVCTKEKPTERADLEILAKILSKKKAKDKNTEKIYW